MSATEPVRRPLGNVSIGISISEAEPSVLSAHGLILEDVNDVTVELSRRLVSLGAQVVLGHQWRPGGIMEAIAGFAQVYQSESGSRPIILNFLAYPDRAALSAADRERLGTAVRIFDDDDAADMDRPKALRRMRERMAKATNARICLCGKVQQPEGLVPGLIEEAALTLKRNKPVYVSRIMGGCAALLARFFAGDRDALMSSFSWTSGSKEYLEVLSQFDLRALAEQCGLEREELLGLFDAQNLDTVVHLTTKGLVARYGEL
jgi:hypothetical protein